MDNIIKDSASLAKKDFANPRVNKFSGWKPGEIEIMNRASVRKAQLEKDLTERQIDKEAHKKLLEKLSNTSNESDIKEDLERIKDSTTNKENDLRKMDEREKTLENIAKSMKASFPGLEYSVAVNDEIKESIKKNSILGIKQLTFNNTTAIIMLIFLAFFDGSNFYSNLKNYINIPFQNLLLSLVVIGGVLTFSLRIKNSGGTRNWIPYLLFLILAQVPQFMGENPQFGIVNLTKNVHHVLFFLMSFVGSLSVTYAVRKTDKKSIQDQKYAPEEKEKDNENIPVEVINDYKNIRSRITSIKIEKEQIEKQISELVKQKKEIEVKIKNEAKEYENQKLNAISEVAKGIEKIDNEITDLKEEIKDVPRLMVEAIEAYRNEIYILKLLSDDETDWIFNELELAQI